MQNPRRKLHSATQAVQKAAHSPTDPDLARVVAAWSYLPEPIKAGILTMVRAADG